MKKRMLLLSVIMLSISSFCSIVAETTVDVNGQVRVRTEFDDKSFMPNYSGDLFTAMRTRLNVKANVDENATAFIQLQDTRTFGGFDQFGKAQSGTLNDGKNVDVHQAYIQVNKVWWDGLGSKIGRFELNLGNQRVFGAVGWSNVGRAWEGGMTWYAQEKYKLTAFVLKAIELNNNADDLDFDIYGLHFGLKNTNLELFGVYEYNADTSGILSDINKLDRINLGLYYHRKMSKFDFTLNGVYQLGNQPASDDSTELDIKAFMFTAEVGHTFEGSKNVRLAAGVDFASGDDPNTSSEFEGYNNLYYTGHKFRGHMDYFIGSNPEGLIDIYGKGQISLADGWLVKGDFHYFKTAQDYLVMVDPSNNQIFSTNVGMEFDFSLHTTTIKGIKSSFGASIFIVNDDYVFRQGSSVSGSDKEAGLWVYEQITINF